MKSLRQDTPIATTPITRGDDQMPPEKTFIFPIFSHNQKLLVVSIVVILVSTIGIYYVFHSSSSQQEQITRQPKQTPLAVVTSTASESPINTQPVSTLSPSLSPKIMQLTGTPSVPSATPITVHPTATITQTTIADSVIAIMMDDGTLFTIQDDGYHRANTPNILKKFYQTHLDIYDFVTIFDDTSPTQSVTHQSVQRTELNLGDGANTYNQTSSYGSNGRLKGINKMGNINSVDISSNGLYNVIIHETGHQWLVNFYSSPLRAVVNANNFAHWTPFLDLDGTDPLGGGTDWVDNKDGTCRSFNKVGEKNVYSWLSLYYMGLASASEVTDEYMLLDSSYEKYFYGTDSNFPCQPTYITIEDFTDTIGPRTPEYPNAQKDFTMGFILVIRSGVAPTQDQKDRLTTIAKNLPEHWTYGTRNRSTMNVINITPLYIN